MKKVIGKESIFASLKQDGMFACLEDVSTAPRFSPEVKAWVREFCIDQTEITKYRSVRNQIFDILDVQSFREIHAYLKNPTDTPAKRERANYLISNMFGLHGTPQEISRKLEEYAQIANDVIRYLCSKVMAPYASYVEITNEIQITSSPVDLLLIIFDNRYHRKARFEATRKLTLMNLAGSIDQRERETDIKSKFSEFLAFLNKNVWSPSMKIGELEIVYLLSRHDKETFACKDVKVIEEKNRDEVTLSKGEKLTLIKRRRFCYNGREYPAYVTIRKKTPEAKVLKLLRKNEKNPAAAVDDELGLMAVLNGVKDIKLFQKHLSQSALKTNSIMTFEDITDTLTGQDYSSSAVGSSARTQMMKFFARSGGMRVEFILHTNTSYLNYIYQRDVAHDEYEVKRIFDTGVAALLFPKDIYHIDHDTVRAQQLQRFRKQIEDF